jgi:hypothetical protein
MSSGNSTTCSDEIQVDYLLDANGPSDNSQVNISETRREDLGKTLRLIRNRRPREWSERIAEVLTRGELESLIDIMGLADREGIEW